MSGVTSIHPHPNPFLPNEPALLSISKQVTDQNIASVKSHRHHAEAERYCNLDVQASPHMLIMCDAQQVQRVKSLELDLHVGAIKGWAQKALGRHRRQIEMNSVMDDADDVRRLSAQ